MKISSAVVPAGAKDGSSLANARQVRSPTAEKCLQAPPATAVRKSSACRMPLESRDSESKPPSCGGIHVRTKRQNDAKCDFSAGSKSRPCSASGGLRLIRRGPAFRSKTQERSKPAPRLADGKVDFGGKGVWAPIWVLDWADKKYVDHAVDVPFTPWGEQKFKERRANLSKDDPEGYCLPPGVPRYTGTPYPFQIIQLPDRVVILYEGASHMYRIIYMDGPSTRRKTKSTRPGWASPSAIGTAMIPWSWILSASMAALGWTTWDIPPATSCM